MAKVKKKLQNIIIRMFVLVSLIMNMAVFTMTDETVGDIEDYDEFDV